MFFEAPTEATRGGSKQYSDLTRTQYSCFYCLTFWFRSATVTKSGVSVWFREITFFWTWPGNIWSNKIKKINSRQVSPLTHIQFYQNYKAIHWDGRIGKEPSSLGGRIWSGKQVNLIKIHTKGEVRSLRSMIGTKERTGRDCMAREWKIKRN